MKKNITIKNVLAVLVILIVIITTINIYGNNQKNVELTQLKDNGSRQMMGYILKTVNNKLIVIDGGTTEDTNNLKDHIYKEGGVVNYWFITHAHDDHAGAFTQIVDDENIKIENIHVSLNDKEWYEKNDPTRAEFGANLIDILNSEKIKNKVHEPNINEEITIDNLNVQILGVKNPEIVENAGNEQSMVIKFQTPQSSLLILGDTGVNSSEKLLNTQKEKLNCDIVQMAHHGQSGATKELYTVVSPKICLWPTPAWLWDNDPGTGYNTGNWKTIETRKWMEELGVQQNYVEKDGDVTIKF